MVGTKKYTRTPIRNVPFQKSDTLAAGDEVTLDIMKDDAQGLGKRARGLSIRNMIGAMVTGDLVYQLYSGDVWSEEIILAQGAWDSYVYEDYVFVELVYMYASGGSATYNVLAVPGIPELWELEELGIPIE